MALSSSVPAFAELGARSNFSFLDGASHPAELVTTAAELDLTGIGICDTNSLAGVVRGHVAAKRLGLPFAVGTRLEMLDGSRYLAWPTDRASYGRLTSLLSRGRIAAEKGTCELSRADLLAHARGLALALLPPDQPDIAFAERLAADAAEMEGLALPLLLAA
jgi:error-prone DNA polymerase